MITKESVLAEAKKLGLTLSDEQVNAHILIGRLPAKAETDSSSGDDDDDQDDGKEKLPQGVKDRMAKLAKQKRDLAEQLTASQKIVDEAKKKQDEQDRKTAEGKGEYEKVTKKMQDDLLAANNIVSSLKDKIKQGAIQNKLEIALLAAGVPDNRLIDALKLMDTSEVEFAWTDEAKLEFEIEDVTSIIEKFKKEKDYLFGEVNAEIDPTTGLRAKRFSGSTGKSVNEKKKEELKKKHLRLFS